MALSRPAMSSEKTLSLIPQLIQLAVPPEKLRCAEYCFRVAVDFSAKFKEDPGTEFLKQILTGLLNTSGGIITVIARDGTSCDRQTLDRWKLKLEDCLTTFVPTDVCRSCIQLLDYSLPITMLVKKSPKLITVNCNMCIRWLAGNKNLEDLDTIRAVVAQVPKKTRCPHPFSHNQSVLYKSTINISEGPNIEYKFWKSVKMFDHPRQRNTYIARLQDERTQRTMFSLPNMPSGGYLILGVEENVMTKTNTVLGQIIREQDEGIFVAFIDNFLRKDTKGNERLWGQSRRTPRQGTDWNVEFIPVIGCSAQERRRVIVLSFNHFEGGVFYQCPKSYLISEEGFVSEMHTEEWFQHLKLSGSQQHHRQEDDAPSRKNLLAETYEHSNSHSTNMALSNVTTPGANSSLEISHLTHSSHTKNNISSSTSSQSTSRHLTAQTPKTDSQSPSISTPYTASVVGEAKVECCRAGSSKMDTVVASAGSVCEVTAPITPAKSTNTNSLVKFSDVNLRISPQDLKSNASTPLTYQASITDGIATQTRPVHTDDQSPCESDAKDDTRILHNTNDEWIQSRDFLSWTKHRTSWKQPIGDSDLILAKRIRQFATHSLLFRMRIPMALNPSKPSIVHSMVDHSAVEDALQCVQQITKEKAFGLATTNWMSMLQTGIKPNSPAGKLLDIFSADDQCDLRLWSIIEAGVFDMHACWQYIFLAGRLTKRKLLVDQLFPARHEFISSVAVDCRLYQLHFGEIRNAIDFKSNKENIVSDVLTFFKPTEECLEDVKASLAQSLLVNKTRIKDIFGDENSIHLTIEQMEIILALGLDKFSFIEGAPGSGKTYLALHMCQKHRCAYMCTTKPFIEFLKFQDVEWPILIETAEDLSRCIGDNLFAKLEYLLIDDVHNSSMPKASWISLFEYIANTPQIKLIILGDSHYQNYKAQSGAIREYLQEFCIVNNFRPTCKSLSVIHRNNRKIASFVKSNFLGNPQYPESLDIACTHTENGDDVEIRYLPDFMSHTSSNSLLEFCQSLTDPQSVVLNESLSYEPKDVAILVDTIKASEDSRKLRDIFRRYVHPRVPIHDASTFPVTGYTIDNLDNFMGFDRKVCILVASDDIIDSDEESGRSVANPRYRTFVASRGVSRVVFVVGSKMTTALAANFHLDNIPGMKRMWHIEEGTEIPDMCFVDIQGQPAILYISANLELNLVSMRGERLKLNVDDPGVAQPLCVATSLDGGHVVVAGEDTWTTGPWRWSVYGVLPTGLKRIRIYDLDSWPLSVCCTNIGVVMIIGKFGEDRAVAQFSWTKGTEMWRYDQTVSKLKDPCSVTICPSTSTIFVSYRDSACIREINTYGSHIRDIPISLTRNSWAISVDVPGRHLFFNRFKGSAIYLHAMTKEGDVQPREVIGSPGRVWSIKLYRDKYLGVTTRNGLALYDVGNLL